MTRRTIVALALAIVGSTTAVAPAAASHVSGASYEGTSSIGALVEFRVSEGGTEVLSYSVEPALEFFSGTKPDGSQCQTLGDNFSNTPVPIVDHRFEFSDADGDLFAGAFDGPGTASGTYRAVAAVAGDQCASPLMTWTATASGGSGDACEAAKAKVRKAKKKVQNADSPAAKKKAKEKLKKAKEEQQEACG